MSGHVGKNIIWLLISQSATWIVSLLTLIIVPDLIGPDGFGGYVLATIIVQYLALIAGFETGSLLVRIVARDHAIIGRYAHNALLLKAVTVVVLSAITLSVAVALDLDTELIVLLAIGCFGMMISNLNFVLQSVLSGMHRMARPAMWTVVQLYVGGLAGIAVLAAGAGVVWYAFVVAIAGLIPLVANRWQLRVDLATDRHFDFHIWRTLMSGGLPLLTLTALNQFYGTIDFPVLAWLAGQTTVGWYSVAYRWAAVPVFICTAVVAASFPRFAEYGKEQGPRFATAVNRAVWLTVVVSVPTGFLLSTVADDVIAIFHESDFAGSVPALRVLALQVPITAVDTVLATALVASDTFRRYIFVALAASILTPLAMYIAIDATLARGGNGATAAALVTTATEVFVFSGAMLMRAPGVIDRSTASRCIAVIAAGATIPLVLWPMGDLHVVLRLVVGTVSYGSAVVALGGVSRSDLDDLRRQLGAVWERIHPKSDRISDAS